MMTDDTDKTNKLKKRNGIIIVISLALILMIGLISVNHNQSTKAKERKMGLFSKAPKAGGADIPVGNHVRIETGYGPILIKLYPDAAPNTVANFKVLAAKGFYNGLTFHRVIPGFMVQGGDPKGDGTGGPGYKIKAEFNKHKHVRGTVAMARSSDPDSAGSQFYICFTPQPHLDGHYTVFGQVVEGMDVVDQIRKGDAMLKVTVEP